MDSESRTKLVSFYKINKKRGRGRPRKIDLMPADEKVAVIQKKKNKRLDEDNLTNQIEENPNSLSVLDILMKELSQEAASLDFERQEAERKGKDTSMLSSKKVTTLKEVGNIFFKKRDAVIEQAFDFESDRFKKLMSFIFEKVKEAADDSGMTGEQQAIFFDFIGEKFEDGSWEKQAMDYIKSD